MTSPPDNAALLRLIAEQTRKHNSRNVYRTGETCSCGAVFSGADIPGQWDEHWAKVSLAVITDYFSLVPLAWSALPETVHTEGDPR